MAEAIQSLWVEGSLSTMERLCIRSFLQNGHEFVLYTYGGVKNIPDGTTVRDGREVVPDSRVFRYNSGFGKGSYAGFANLFRYQLLHDCGGWWVDTDVICLRTFDLSKRHVVATGWEPKIPKAVTNCVLKLPPGDPALKYCLDAFARVNTSTIRFAETGPDLLAKALRELGLMHYTVEWDVFCPIDYRDVSSLVEPYSSKVSIDKLKRFLLRRPQKQVPKNAYAVHLWNEMWKYNGLEKDNRYDSASLFEQLKQRYLS